MKELQLQDKYLVHFFCERKDGLNYQERPSSIVCNDLFIKSDLMAFLSETDLNKESYKNLLKDFKGDEKKLANEITTELNSRIKDATNMAIFINNNKSFTFCGYKFHLFYPSCGEFEAEKSFNQNIFSIVQEFSYIYKYQDKKVFHFRPDLMFFVNGIYFGYSELKSNYNNQNADKNGRNKVVKDYKEVVLEYLKIAGKNDLNQSIRKDFLKIFEKAIHITATDLFETYVLRNITSHFEEIKVLNEEGKYDFSRYEERLLKDFKSYPVSDKRLEKIQKFEEIFRALFSKKMIEKEILYYNFIEKDIDNRGGKKELKNEKGKLISPRPKQKFGTDKIIKKIDEFLENEHNDAYFIKKLEEELTKYGISELKKQELIEKRKKYQNNKHVYSLLLQYAAGFGKSNIIGWTTLQLKDLKKNNHYVYDKIMIIVDRLQLRDQIGNKMLNMNVNNKMFVEADSKQSFVESLSQDTRIVIVNIQKFQTIKEILTKDVIEKLSKLRIAFLIDEVHRSNTGSQHSKMVNLFDELQSSFDNEDYVKIRKKKNLIIGFTATPSDNTLARFGEYNKYAENEKIWVPFDSYTMKEAIEDGYILNPLKGIVPVSAKMYFEKPDSEIQGFEDDLGYEEEEICDEDGGIDENGKKYTIRKQKIYENEDRIKAISKFVVARLLSVVYPKIRGYAKAMLAVSSIKAAIKYKQEIDKIYKELAAKDRFKDAPIYIVYSSSQEHSRSSGYNDGLTEEKVLHNFAAQKNGLIIVVDKLQTGFDEPKLHTLFLDKEISGINAIQTISRVNRTTKHKKDCKIIDFSHRNINIKNIKKAFEHFSNVVVSDFDPIGEEKILLVLYQDLINSKPHQAYFEKFRYSVKNVSDMVNKIVESDNFFDNWIKENPNHSFELKEKINKYFNILNNIENVIDFDKKLKDDLFLKFWKMFNDAYNKINKISDAFEDIEIYYDNKIGVIEDIEIEPKEGQEKKGKVVNKNNLESNYKFDILDIIKQRNEDEEKIEEMIKDFENKILSLFDFIKKDEDGNFLIAKIKDLGGAFDENSVYGDFKIILNKFIRRNRDSLGAFFVREVQDLSEKLCDDFECWISET